MEYTNVGIEFVLWKWPKKKDGIYPVKLRITHRRSRKYYGRQYGISGKYTEKEFQAIQGNPRNPEYKREKAKLEKIRNTVVRFVDKMGAFGFSFDKLEEMMGRTDKDVVLISEALMSYVEGKEKSTISVYESSRNAILKFDPNLTFHTLTVDKLRKFESYLKDQDISESTISIYMSNIRAAYNHYKQNDSKLKELYPFGKGRYIPPKKKRSKKLTDIKTIQKLLDFKTDNKAHQLARDIYLFSFFTGGSNTKDLYLFTTDSIQNNCLRFYRAKTGVYVEIPIIGIVAEIIKRQKTGKYLLPVFSNKSKTEWRLLKSTNATVNNHLKKITKKHVVLHYARHSFATYANNAKIEFPIIRELMAHSDKSMTEGYMSFPISEKKEALDKLYEYVISFK